MPSLADNWRLVEIVLTLAATGTLMWFVRHYFIQSNFCNVLAVMAGVGLLCVLYLLGLQSAGLILMALLVLLAVVTLLQMFAES
jgi:hypothetical protein